MLVETFVKPLLFVTKEGAKRSEILRVIRDALLGTTVSFTATKVLEKTYNAVEKKISTDTDTQN